jgi:hypothetical protein
MGRHLAGTAAATPATKVTSAAGSITAVRDKGPVLIGTAPVSQAVVLEGAASVASAGDAKGLQLEFGLGQSLCADCGLEAVCAVVARVPRTDMVMVPPTGLKRTGGRAVLKARARRAMGVPAAPAPLDISPEALVVRVAHRNAMLLLRKARRAELVCMRALLLHLEENSGRILDEVHTEQWRPHWWGHWIFPTNALAERESVEPSAVTHRTVGDFLAEDTFSWRQVLERVVGKAEGTVGGLDALFSPHLLGRIDGFIGIFASAPSKHVWLFRILDRLRRLRAWHGGLVAPGSMLAASKPSRKARLVSREVKRIDDAAFAAAAEVGASVDTGLRFERGVSGRDEVGLAYSEVGEAVGALAGGRLAGDEVAIQGGAMGGDDVAPRGVSLVVPVVAPGRARAKSGISRYHQGHGGNAFLACMLKAGGSKSHQLDVILAGRPALQGLPHRA